LTILYRKFVETFHVVSECKTALFSVDLCYTRLATSTAVLTIGDNIGVASSDSLTDSDLQLLTEREQDRPNETFIYTILTLA